MLMDGKKKEKKNLWYDEIIGLRGCSLSLIIIVLKFILGNDKIMYNIHYMYNILRVSCFQVQCL